MKLLVCFGSLAALVVIFVAGIICTAREMRRAPEPEPPSRDHHRKARAYGRGELIK